MTGDHSEQPTVHRRERERDLAAAVHELRTPLATVQGFLETLLERGDAIDAETRAHIVAVAHRNAVLLGERIDGLLAYQRLTSEPDLDLTAARLLPVVDGVVEDCAGILPDHRVEVDVDPALRVVLDREAIRHVLSNLLSNATRHSPPESTITVRALAEGDRVWLAVTDRGEGIAEEDLPHVFEAFYRGAGQDRGGTGLGLTVVHRYVEHWGGRIQLDSTPGAGTTVAVSLDRAVAGGVAHAPGDLWVHEPAE